LSPLWIAPADRCLMSGDPVVPVQPCPHRTFHRARLRVGPGDLVVRGPAAVVGAVGAVGPPGLCRILARTAGDGPAHPAPTARSSARPE